jgi:hypothetical protein
MYLFRSFAWLAVASALFFGATAYAATCSLNIAQMYNTAVAKGWKFKCMKGVLHFDAHYTTLADDGDFGAGADRRDGF